jgi:hypothetical protein
MQTPAGIRGVRGMSVVVSQVSKTRPGAPDHLWMVKLGHGQ